MVRDRLKLTQKTTLEERERERHGWDERERDTGGGTRRNVMMTFKMNERIKHTIQILV